MENAVQPTNNNPIPQPVQPQPVPSSLPNIQNQEPIHNYGQAHADWLDSEPIIDRQLSANDQSSVDDEEENNYEDQFANRNLESDIFSSSFCNKKNCFVED